MKQVLILRSKHCGIRLPMRCFRSMLFLLYFSDFSFATCGEVPHVRARASERFCCAAKHGRNAQRNRRRVQVTGECGRMQHRLRETDAALLVNCHLVSRNLPCSYPKVSGGHSPSLATISSSKRDLLDREDRHAVQAAPCQARVLARRITGSPR